jgi:hypothetical protein
MIARPEGACTVCMRAITAAVTFLMACAAACAAGSAATAASGFSTPEADDVALSFTLDEHLLANPFHDMDYNGGGKITFFGARAARGPSPDHILGLIDRSVRIDLPSAARVERPTHALALGLLVFTPRNLADQEPVSGDRPYASLLFLSSGRRYVPGDRPVAYESSLTLGILGLGAAGSVQRGLHRLAGAYVPQGWAHQISAGGEPTARYSLARQSLLGRCPSAGRNDCDWKWTLAGSVGTVTEGGIALQVRWGRIASPWWAFSPEQSVYMQETQPAPPRLARASSPELFALTGVRFKLRAYDAFLEGQFRHSDFRYSSSSLNHALGEVWLGAEFRTSSGWELRYLARWQTPELRSGIGSRSLLWGSVEVAKSFGD